MSDKWWKAYQGRDTILYQVDWYGSQHPDEWDVKFENRDGVTYPYIGVTEYGQKIWDAMPRSFSGTLTIDVTEDECDDH